MFKITFIFLFALLFTLGNKSLPQREGHQKFGLFNLKTEKGTNDISGRKKILFHRQLHVKTESLLKNGLKQSYAIPASGIKYNLNNEHFFALPVKLNTRNQISESFSNINLNYNVVM